MSIILKGIDLPKNCLECPIEGNEVDNDGFDEWYCKITGQTADTYERPSNCPLIQIDRPHGRLIDGGELYKDFENQCSGECDCCVHETENYNCGLIANAPTILEAEE